MHGSKFKVFVVFFEKFYTNNFFATIGNHQMTFSANELFSISSNSAVDSQLYYHTNHTFYIKFHVVQNRVVIRYFKLIKITNG